MLFVDEFCGILVYIKFGADVTSQYEKAVEYFRLGYDRANESKAFEKYRNAYLRSHTTLVISVLVLVVLFLVIVTSKCLSQRVFRRKRTKKPEERGMTK